MIFVNLRNHKSRIYLLNSEGPEEKKKKKKKKGGHRQNQDTLRILKMVPIRNYIQLAQMETHDYTFQDPRDLAASALNILWTML